MESQETFLSHLIELRDRLIKCLLAIGVAFVPAAIFGSDIYDFLARPVIATLPEGSRMIATGVITPFLIPVKIAAVTAFLAVLPYVLYQVWAFVAPGLYAHEKRLVLPLVVSSTVLFVAGMAFCYYFVFNAFFSFINDFAPKSISVAPDIEAYFNFMLGMFLAFGIAFEIPVVVVVLAITGMVKIEQLREWRGYVIVGIFVIAAIVTPPDVVSQLALAIPMCFLYEIGIIVAQLSLRARKQETPAPETSNE